MLLNFIHSLKSQKRIAGGAAVLAITQFGASVAGLFRDRILASTFPPGVDQLDTVSVYIAAFRPSDLLFQFFIMSMFSVALVPLLAGHLAHEKEEEMNKLLSSVLVLGSMFFVIVTLLFLIFFESLAPALVDFTGSSLRLYVRFGILACTANLLFVAGNAFGQYLITRQTYWVYGITPILYTLGTIGGTLWLTDPFGPVGPMLGTLIGAIVYVLVRMAAAVRSGYIFQLPVNVFHPDLKEMSLLMLPRMFALGAVQVQLLFFDKLASGLPLGSVTVNAYARNFQAAAVGILGVALAQSVYSLLSQSVAKKEIDRYWSYLRKGVGLSIGLSVCAAIGLVVLAKICAMLVNLREPAIVASFVTVLAIYALSVPFEGLNHLLFRAIYATKHTIVPAAVGVLNGVISIGIAWMFVKSMGVFAIPVGFVIGQLIQVVLLGGFLKLRVRRLE